MNATSRLGASTLGVWTRADALACLTRGRIDALIASGCWQVLWPGVYADNGYVLDAEQRAMATVLAATRDHVVANGQPPAAATGRTAARMLRLPLIDDDDPATGGQEHRHDDVAVRTRSSVVGGSDGRRLHRLQRDLDAAQVMRLSNGLWVTSPERTLLECARTLTADALVCLLDAALHRHLWTSADVAQALERQAWCWGAPALRQALADSDARAESPAESLVRLRLLPHLPALVPQLRLHDGSGRLLRRFDLADRAIRFAVEADGRRGHAGRHMVARDQRRDVVSEGEGWRVERCTWWDARAEPAAMVSRVVRAARSHAELVNGTAHRRSASAA